MAMTKKFQNLLQLSILQAAEIKEQITDGDLDELKELNKKMLRKLESVVETVQEEMFDDGKPL